RDPNLGKVGVASSSLVSRSRSSSGSPAVLKNRKEPQGSFFVPALCRYWQQGSLPLDELVLVPPGSPLLSATPSASRNLEYRQERATARLNGASLLIAPHAEYNSSTLSCTGAVASEPRSRIMRSRSASEPSGSTS